MRRLPQQDRSAARISVILDAAERVFTDVGYDNATTNAIAREAGTSIGSLYRFFPDKKALFTALSERYSRQILDLFRKKVTPEFLKLDVPEIVEQIFDMLDEFFVQNPSFEAIIVLADASPEIAEEEKLMRENTARVLAEIFGMRVRDIPPKRRMLMALTCISLMNSFQRTCLAQFSNFSRAAIKAEYKLAIAGYLDNALRAPR
ncbi:MAG: TetR/AcrR family transcriptional regulator [Candidatus Obscuribacterales bacterium]